MRLTLLILVTLLSSCQPIIDWIEGDDPGVIRLKEGQKPSVTFAFSNNINGETHPCGCRQFPLGGIPQVAGILHTWNQETPVIYADTGDTFFPNAILPESLRKSMIFTAQSLATFFDSLGMRYFVPGDQDFAAGVGFLSEISKKHKFKFLMTNALKPGNIKFIKHDVLTLPNQTKLYLFGIVWPEVLRRPVAQYFSDPVAALKSQLKKLKLQPTDRVMVLSHGGIDADKTWHC